MSDAPEDQDDATEDPSERRLEEARKEGQVPLSREAVHTGSLVVGAFTIAGLAPGLGSAGRDAMRAGLSADTDGAVQLPHLCAHAMAYGLAAVGAIAASAIVATMVQTQGGVW